jgi:hypothetical protein
MFLLDVHLLVSVNIYAKHVTERKLTPLRTAAFPLFGIQMYNKLNYHWASSLLAFLTAAMLPFPWLFFRYGKQLRKKSRFAQV